MRSRGTPGAATRKGSGLEPGVELMPMVPGNEWQKYREEKYKSTLEIL